jgi:hypothetical protein
MGTVQNSRSLVRVPGMVDSRLFAEQFASANAKVTARRTSNSGIESVGESPDSPAPFVKTWVLSGSLGTPSARVEER